MSDETLTLYSIPQEEKEYYDAEKLVFTDVIHEKLEKNDDVLVLETKYVLKSVLLHLGKSLNYGHYLTEFGVEKRNAQNHHMKWRRANDERVTVVDHQHNDKDSIKNSQNYLLLYEKVSETLVSKPAKEVFNLGKEEA
ncbi:hypothetical protein AGDE_14657 [Angomonas deanei]|uniref:Ubiquitin carboxyl-terminal hydrolase, putative n=1 Tax=Angomonas deanei TaxID=59799 RepID=A0A7G2CT80_9TRYP|nr:hypothetical protein AGDE_14657 [Angomonas deanei]CAD2221643.1 Ubiquitin carboxyl-terminal hydrolase, putative [Angomonas deanei]|eukprot:EPY20467.1 hypothetical protein AGDE_14657 [Angomonas deanei]